MYRMSTNFTPKNFVPKDTTKIIDYNLTLQGECLIRFEGEEFYRMVMFTSEEKNVSLEKKLWLEGGGDLFKEVISSFHDISEKGHLVLKNNSFNNKFFKRSSRKIVKKKKRSHGILVFKNYFLRFIRVVFLI